MQRLSEWVRQPAYTGENRCAPCTVVNLLIAAAVSGALAVVSPVVAALAFAVSVAVVYLRGYLVPGTPTITARYFPEAVLELFGKEAVAVERDAVLADVPLVAACGVVERSPNDGRRLAASFRRAWNDRIGDADTADPDRDDVADLFGVDADAVSVMAGDRYLVDGERLVQWPSAAAFVADVTAGRELQARCRGWTELSIEDRVAALTALRSLRRECPACGASLLHTEETVDPCCQPSVDVVSVSCEECGAHVAEAQSE